MTLINFQHTLQALAAPQYNLPDDVVAPVLPPFPTLKSFDIPKLPMVGAKYPLGLNTSNGSNSGDNFVSLYYLSVLNNL